MSKQIFISASGARNRAIERIFKDIVPYISYFGFRKHPMIFMEKEGKQLSCMLFVYEDETIFLDKQVSQDESVMRLMFTPAKNQVIFDVVMMRINQISRRLDQGIFIKKSE